MHVRFCACTFMYVHVGVWMFNTCVHVHVHILRHTLYSYIFYPATSFCTRWIGSIFESKTYHVVKTQLGDTWCVIDLRMKHIHFVQCFVMTRLYMLVRSCICMCMCVRACVCFYTELLRSREAGRVFCGWILFLHTSVDVYMNVCTHMYVCMQVPARVHVLHVRIYSLAMTRFLRDESIRSFWVMDASRVAEACELYVMSSWLRTTTFIHRVQHPVVARPYMLVRVRAPATAYLIQS